MFYDKPIVNKSFCENHIFPPSDKYSDPSNDHFSPDLTGRANTNMVDHNFLAKERLWPIVGCKVNESPHCCRRVHNNIDYSFPQDAGFSFKTSGTSICYNQIHCVILVKV